MLLFDSLSAKKKNVPKSARRPLRLFVCGPTVYDMPHLGHARTYLVFDALVKFLRADGYRVHYLQNITDIDDKIILRAARAHLPPQKIAARYLKAYLDAMQALGIDAVDEYARATDYIPHIVRQVTTLIKRGAAYRIEGEGYYFDITTFPSYGKLSRRTVAQAEDAESRIDAGVHKRNKGDFCLWKFASPAHLALLQKKRGGERRPVVVGATPYWRTSLGWGRPGWHIEDTAITEAHFGPQYELHGGGVDLKFPHHEAEIAQQETASGRTPFVQIWLHTGVLTIRGKKMSKSLKNFVTIQEFLQRFHPQALRLFVLSSHYRSPIDYSPAHITAHEKNLLSLMEIRAKLDRQAASSHSPPAKITTLLQNLRKEFLNALRDDFATPLALAALWKLTGEVNKKLWLLSPAEARAARNTITSLCSMLGIAIPQFTIPPKIRSKANKREKYRTNKQFILADKLRKEIEQLGYEIEDTPRGQILLPRSVPHYGNKKRT